MELRLENAAFPYVSFAEPFLPEKEGWYLHVQHI